MPPCRRPYGYNGTYIAYGTFLNGEAHDLISHWDHLDVEEPLHHLIPPEKHAEVKLRRGSSGSIWERVSGSDRGVSKSERE